MIFKMVLRDEYYWFQVMGTPLLSVDYCCGSRRRN